MAWEWSPRNWGADDRNERSGVHARNGRPEMGGADDRWRAPTRLAPGMVAPKLGADDRMYEIDEMAVRGMVANPGGWDGEVE